MKPKAFVLYPNQWEPLSCLSDEQLGRPFRFMRMQINIDIKKYQQLCEKRKEAANKRWENHSKNANAYFAMHKKEKENEIEKENENEIEKENESENENESSSCAAVVISEPVANAEEAAAAAAASFNMEEAKEYCLKNVLPWFNGILDNADSKIPRIQDFNDQRTERRQRQAQHLCGIVRLDIRRGALLEGLRGRI